MDRRNLSPATIDVRTFSCEFLGTLLLVFFAVGAAVVSGQFIGTLGIALAFGFVLLAIAYVIGPISGSHVNPAVTLGMLLARRINLRTAVEYWIAQIAGAIVGAALLLLVAKQVPGSGRTAPSAPTATATARPSASTSSAPSSPR